MSPLREWRSNDFKDIALDCFNDLMDCVCRLLSPVPFKNYYSTSNEREWCGISFLRTARAVRLFVSIQACNIAHIL